MSKIKEFFEFAIKREQIRLRKEAGDPPPWTDDPILQRFFFCNVFREDDKTTRWFAKNIRNAVQDVPHRAFVACVAFRWFNHIPSGEIMRNMLVNYNWDPTMVRWQLKALPQKVGGAYVVRSPDGMDKVDGLLKCITAVVDDTRILLQHHTLRSTHKALLDYHCIGPFMAYEIVTDLRHTAALWDATDIMTWASPGPGCARGLGWVFARDPKEFRYGTHQQDQLSLMTLLLASSNEHWPWYERPWEMREVEHVLCEYDKYMRGRSGQTLKRKYNV